MGNGVHCIAILMLYNRNLPTIPNINDHISCTNITQEIYMVITRCGHNTEFSEGDSYFKLIV